jgi:uncharacterized protein
MLKNVDTIGRLPLTLALLAALSVVLAAEITVTGSGVVWAEPDQATVEVGWSGVEPDVGAAVAGAEEAIAQVRAALEATGIAPEDVRTTGYFIWPEERWNEDGEPNLVGYRVTHSLQVTVRDVDALGRVITAATEAGANQVGGVGFTVADPGALEGEARAAAFAAARARAAELAALAGQSLGEATAIEELTRGAPVALEMALDRGGLGGGSVAPGRHAVEVVVQVTFSTEE